MSDDIKEVLRPTIIYFLTISILLWFLYFQTIEPPQELELILPGFTLNQLLLPLVAIATSRYLSTLVERLTQGRLSKPISISLNRLGYNLPLYYISRWPQIPSFLVSLLSLPLFITLISAVLSIIDIYFIQYEKFTNPIINGLEIAIIGFLLSNVFIDTLEGLRNARSVGEFGSGLDSILFSIHIESLYNAFRVAIILTMFASFLGVLKDNKNQYLGSLGKYFGENLFSKFLASLLVVTYFTFMRGEVLIWLGDNSKFLPFIEWGLICIFFYRSYKAINRYSESFVDQQERLLKWTRHAQEIRYSTDQKLDNLSRLVESFIERGDKSLLEVNLVGLMATYGYNPNRIYNALREFLEYEDLVLGAITFNWQIKYVEKKNHENRKLVMMKTLENLEGYGLITSGESQENIADIEVIESESERITG